MFSKIIRNFIAKMVAGRSDDGIMITLKDPKKVDFQAAMMEDLLMRNGIDPRAITSEAELKMLLNQISKNEASRIRNMDVSGIRGVRSGDVVDMEGNKIPEGSRIMGGQAVEDQKRFFKGVEIKDPKFDENMPFDSDAEKLAEIKMSNEAYEQIPPGSRGGPDDIAAPVQSQEETLRNMTEAEIKANLEKQNKDSVQRILKRKNREDVYGLEDYDTTNMSDLKKELIRTETKLGNLNPESPDFRDRAKPLIDKIEAIQKKMREDKADGGRIGFFMGSQFPKGLAALRQMLQYYGKKSDVVKNPSDILKMTNPNKVKQMLEDPAIYSKFNVKEGIGAPETLRNIIKQKEADRIEMVEEMLGSARNIRKADDDAMKYKNDMIEDMMKKGIDKETAKGMAETITKMAEDAGLGKFKDTPKLTKEGVLELENILKNMKTGGKDKRSLNADGGRIGLKDGPKMTRRTFLKYLTGLAAIPIVGKIVKPLKTVKGVKNVPIIKTSDVKGKPEWFDQLVNKVIIEGDDVSKKFATKDREIVHMKEIDDETVVKVTQDMDEDVIRVDYESPENMYGDPVGLEFKKGRADEGTKGTPPDEFQTTESIPVARADGPDDYKIDIDEGGGQSISDLVSDVSKLKEYATGKKPTLKEIVQTKKRKDQTRAISEGDYEAETDFVTNRQGEPIIDMEPDIDYASGGIARMLGE